MPVTPATLAAVSGFAATVRWFLLCAGALAGSIGPRRTRRGTAVTDLHSISQTSAESVRPRLCRRWRLGTYTAVITLIAAGASVGWYAERQWNPNALIDEGCTIEGDTLLTIGFSHAPGDIVSVRVTSEPDRVVVAARTEHPPDGGGIRPGVGTMSTYSTMLGHGLAGRPLLDAHGHRLPCRVVDPPRRGER